MIKINLLPVKRRKKPKPVPGFLIAMVLLFVVSAVAVVYANHYMGTQVTQLEAQKADNENRKKDLDEKIKEVQGFEKLNETFTSRKNVIEELAKDQSLPARLLDEMSVRLTEGVWLGSMKISKGSIDITGMGFSTSDIVSYVQSLKSSAYFADVQLTSTVGASEEGVDTFRFVISMKLKEPEAETKGPDGGA